jgi:hypothetical protein
MTSVTMLRWRAASSRWQLLMIDPKARLTIAQRQRSPRLNKT